MPWLKADITDKIRLESDSSTSTAMVCIHILRTTVHLLDYQSSNQKA